MDWVSYWVSLVWIGLFWYGLGWVGLDWIGLVWYEGSFKLLANLKCLDVAFLFLVLLDLDLFLC